MTPDPTLTDEELAEIEERVNLCRDVAPRPGGVALHADDLARVVMRDAPALIAALRGAYADVERHAQAHYDAVFDLTQKDAALRASRAEVERLREAVDEAQLRSIEARNPGIDIAEVRRMRDGETRILPRGEAETEQQRWLPLPPFTEVWCPEVGNWIPVDQHKGHGGHSLYTNHRFR
jgi:hypothetical protein